MLVVGLVYAGLIAALLGAASLVKPLAFLGIRSRPRGAFVLGIGLIVAATSAFLPAGETLLFRTLTWLRRLGQPGPESILNAPERLPLLEVATGTSFLLLAEEPEREVVVGTLVGAPAGVRIKKPTPDDFKALEAPGFAKATMNFRLQEAGTDTWIVTTETRVYATDALARRRFAAYWRVIYPGSALIRRMWLRAIKLRAEAAGS